MYVYMCGHEYTCTSMYTKQRDLKCTARNRTNRLEKSTIRFVTCTLAYTGVHFHTVLNANVSTIRFAYCTLTHAAVTKHTKSYS